jgi:hypothetical protein
MAPSHAGPAQHRQDMQGWTMVLYTGHSARYSAVFHVLPLATFTTKRAQLWTIPDCILPFVLQAVSAAR